jgi:hypothetical protein
VNALLGGVTDLVRQRMKADGIYEEFIAYAEVCMAPFHIPCFLLIESVY